MYLKSVGNLLAGAVALISFPELAAAAGVLAGTVSDAQSAVYLQNANISIDELNLETTSSDGGRFEFHGVPAGTYTLTARYMGADIHQRQVVVSDGARSTEHIRLSVNGTTLETVLVIGQPAGYARALNQKRSAMNFKDVVSSDFIGKLPDENVSDALQRLAGISIVRDQGEGRYVRLRGMSPELSTTAINGLSIPSPESRTRAVALDVIPSILVSRLEVSKSLTPDMDGDAVGGNINLVSLSGLDHADSTFSSVAELRDDEQSSTLSPKFAGLYTNRFAFQEQLLGVALSVSHQERHFGSENVEGDWRQNLGGSEFAGARELQQRDYQITRTRSGATLNLDWLTARDDRLYLHGLFSDYTDHEFRHRNKYRFRKGDLVHIEETAASWTDAQIIRELKNRKLEQKILSLVSGGEHRRERWKLHYELGFSRSEEDAPDRVDIEFRQKKLDIGYASIGNTPTLLTETAGLNPSAYAIDNIATADSKSRDTLRTVKVDLSTEGRFFGHAGTLQLGLKSTGRNKSTDYDTQIYDSFEGMGRQSLADFSTGLLAYGLGTFGPQISPATVSDFLAGEVLPGLNTQSRDARVLSRALSDSDFVSREDINAAYLMLNSQRGPLTLVTGVRYELTDFKSDGLNSVADIDRGIVQSRPVQYAQRYDQWLPSVNLKYELTDAMLLRAAYSHSYGRPSFGQLAPSPVETELEDGELSIKGLGNPALKPYEAKNVDLALEFYGRGINAASVSLFFKRIDNFIFEADARNLIDPQSFVDGQEVTEVDAVIPLNGDAADVYGLEIAFNRSLGWGFYLQGNATLSRSRAQLPGSLTERGPMRLPEQSDLLGNLALGWERGAFSSRVAAVYADEIVHRVDLQEPRNDIYEHRHVQVDVTAQYQVSPSVGVTFSALNLLDEPRHLYHGLPGYVTQYEVYGPSFSLGIRFDKW